MEKGVEDWKFRISAKESKLQQLNKQKLNQKQLEFKQKWELT